MYAYISYYNVSYNFSDDFKFLQDTRQQITKLSGVHSLLKRLQFLFKLPGKLKVTLQEGHYSQVKVKLSLVCIKHHTMKMYGVVELLLFGILQILQHI
jgi:hypothetical protein